MVQGEPTIGQLVSQLSLSEQGELWGLHRVFSSFLLVSSNHRHDAKEGYVQIMHIFINPAFRSGYRRKMFSISMPDVFMI